jgi:CO/xanthine dehydrogenase Mo-binding subunit
MSEVLDRPATAPELKVVGTRPIRPDGVDKVTGRAAFAADTNMPGMIWGKVLRSPHPHARIRSIDTSKAEKLPGVKAVVTSRDVVDFPLEKGAVMLGIQDMRWMCRNVMARDKALFPGHPVAAVAATTEAIAAEACKLIEVDYEVLPFAIEIDDALKPDAPILHEFTSSRVSRPTSRASSSTRRATSRKASSKPMSLSSALSPRARCTRAISSRTPA